MRCPVCHVTLTTGDRHGVEIDYCPKCYGIWLDRGELNQILQRSASNPGEVESEAALSMEPAPPHPDPDAEFGKPGLFPWRMLATR